MAEMTAACTFPRQPAGLYCHIPFCRSKCSYCAFTSYPCPDRPPAAYPAAMAGQLDLLAPHPLVQELTFGSIFIGGGTPTIYPAAELARLLDRSLKLLPFTGPVEITVETNPNTVTLAELTFLRRAGVNRLSIGVQSFAEPVLAASGRSHTGAEAHAAIDLARQAGFTNINLDLIYGLPRQTPEIWRATLAAALAHAPEHLALYELTIEEGTPFAERANQGKLALPDEDMVLAMEQEAGELLAAHGYQHYEIANFAQPGFTCRHNLNYWQNGSYLGLGAGAVSCLAGIRIRNVSDPTHFGELVAAGRPPFAEAEALSAAARYRETVIMGLRLLDGISLADMKERYGQTPREFYGPLLDRLQAEGLLTMDQGCLRLTARGLPLANQVLAQLV
jgi:oxygen-independent coproporphyrinogen III oxidase